MSHQAKRRAKADSETRTYAAAIALLLGVVAIAYYAFAHPTPGKHYDIKAIVTSSNQIRTGQPVRIAGVDVGTIRSIDRGPGHTTQITMRINEEGQPLHKDAKLKIRPRLFLEGSYFVDLDAGSPSSPTIDGGATIPLSQTAVPVQLNDILSELDSTTRDSFDRIIREVDTAISGGGARSFRRSMPNLAPALRDLAWVAKAARGTETHDVSTLVREGAKLASVTAERDTDLAGLIVNLDRTAQALNSGDGALGRTIDALDRVLIKAPPALVGLDATLPTLVRFSRAIRPALPDAPGQLRQINAALKDLASLVTPAQRKRTIKALTVTFEDLPQLVDRLGSLFPVTKDTLECLQTHIVPSFNQTVPDGSLSTGQPMWQELVHALVGFSSISQNFDANGFITRYAAAFSGSTLSAGSVPVVGDLVAAAPPMQSRPKWLGSGKFPAFRPDAKCKDQPLADPASETTQPSMRAVKRTAPAPVSRSALRKVLAK